LLTHSPLAVCRLASCLRLLCCADLLRLSGDAVYALQPGTANLQSLQLMPASVALYALDEDLAGRGLQSPERVQFVDYPAFVEFCTRYAKVNSWL
uniref:sulfurtransferase complex subunit TusB n=1 Tax=Pseudomonas sp. UBA6323 TaxID=1947329 RepID=UPI0025E988EB